MIGTTLSHFRITAKLGEGGMGEVYRAEDTKLGRDVAIKVLPEAFVSDSERMARFEQEAKVLASLSHTNIAGIHQVEQVDDTHFLVMELAEGDTLAERIERGPLPVEEAVPIAIQIAEGLEAAHLRGIVHRDLKPANIKITPERQVKILDFGLARAMTEGTKDPDSSPMLSQSPTLAAHITGAGMILGTAAYMSPEQARGEVVDWRSDVWAFGVVMMEMLTGKSVWTSSSVSDTLAGVLAREPDWEELPASTPKRVRRLLERCLEKDRRRRLQAIGEARIELESYLADPSAEREDRSALGATTRPAWQRALPWAIAGAGLIAALVAWMRPASMPVEIPVRKYTVARTAAGMLSGMPSLSPAGTRAFYVDEDRLYLRDLDQLSPVAVPDSEGARSVFWSHDGSDLAFSRDGKLWRLDVETLRSQVVADLPEDFQILTGAWSPSGKIFLAQWRGGLFEVPAGGGDIKEVLAVDDSWVDIHCLIVLPDEEALLSLTHTTSEADVLEIIRGRERQRIGVLPEGALPFSLAYSPTGHLLFSRFDRNRGIWAVSFSLDSFQISSEPVMVLRGGVAPALGSNGTLSYLAELDPLPTQMVWIDRQGAIVETAGPQREEIRSPRLSPDGQQVAFSSSDPFGRDADIWVYEFERDVERQLTSSEFEDSSPAWTPDGSRIGFARRRPGDWDPESNRIGFKNSDGTGEVETTASGWGRISFTPDGGTMVFTSWDLRLEEDVLRIDLEGPSESTPVLAGETRFLDPEVSPDGMLLAYTSNETGEEEIWVSRFPEVQNKWQVSKGGGSHPRWSRDGSRLFFVESPPGGGGPAGMTLMEVTVEPGADLSIGSPQPVFGTARADAKLALGRGYDISPDGDRFLVVQEFGERKVDLVIVQNWLAEQPELTRNE